jgi:hypothetical protein
MCKILFGTFGKLSALAPAMISFCWHFQAVHQLKRLCTKEIHLPQSFFNDMLFLDTLSELLAIDLRD